LVLLLYADQFLLYVLYLRYCLSNLRGQKRLWLTRTVRSVSWEIIRAAFHSSYRQ